MGKVPAGHKGRSLLHVASQQPANTGGGVSAAAPLSWCMPAALCFPLPLQYALHVYNEVMNTGQKYGIRNAGYYALRSLRIEKFFAFWGQDLDAFTTPMECGREFQVKLEKVQWKTGIVAGPSSAVMPPKWVEGSFFDGAVRV